VKTGTFWENPNLPLVGQSTSRLEDEPLLTGDGRFVDDLNYPHMLHAAFLRSAHAHAILQKLDVGSARAMPGVVAAYAFSDIRPFLRGDRLVVALPNKAILQSLDRPVLAIDEVTYVGEPVAVVVAGSRAQAEDAVAAIVADYDVLDAVVDCVAALEAGAPRAHRHAPDNVVAKFDLTYGDADSAFNNSLHVFKETIVQSRGGSHSIECRGAVAVHDQTTDQLTLWTSTQTPHAAMRLLAEMLGREENSLRVVAPDVGGGFGPKLVFYPEELIVALAALLLKCPVIWIEDRREHFISTTQERDQVWTLEIAVDGAGGIQGIRGSMIHDHGASTARGINVAFEALQALTMPYNVPACAVQVRMAVTNKVPVTPVRGAGQPQGVFAMERMLDRVARELNLTAPRCASAILSAAIRCRARSRSRPGREFRSSWIPATCRRAKPTHSRQPAGRISAHAKPPH